MSLEHESFRLFSRRALLVGGLQTAVFAVLGGRLFHLQIIEQDKFTTQAEDNRISVRLMFPPRGEIFDRHGVKIAANQPNYKVFVIPERTNDINATLAKVGRYILLDEKSLNDLRRFMERNPRFVPALARQYLTWEELSALELRLHELPEIEVELGEFRHYPFKEAFAHVLGYVAPVSPGEGEGNRAYRLPDAVIGKSGVERRDESTLMGVAGERKVEINAGGRVLRELQRREGVQGRSQTLTLDADLQAYAYQRMEGHSGSVVVMDIHSGEVLVMTSAPAFDPNKFTKGIPTEIWRELLNNEMTPLVHKAIFGQYAPGSTFKMMVALAGLEHKAVRPNDTIRCNHRYHLGRTVFHCWKKEGHGVVALEKSLYQSCDIYYYDLARRTGLNNMVEMCHRFGLGARTGIDLDGEKEGLIPTAEWKRRRFNEPWHEGETVIFGIGQGYILTTPLQLCVMTARLANGGYAVEPRLTYSPTFKNVTHASQNFRKMDINPEHLRLMQQGMLTTVNSWSGTAIRSRLPFQDFLMAGKTGTSQVRRITKEERARGVIDNADLPWNRRDHSLFVAYAPYHQPRYAISVIMEHGGSGSALAAPIARDVMTQLRHKYAGS